MKTYVNKEQKAKDVKSTGYTFCLVGILGLVFIALLATGVIPFNMDQYQKIMISIVMGLVFTIFFVIGLISFRQLKRLNIDAESQSKIENDVTKTFIKKYGEKIKTIQKNSKSQEAFFERNQEIIDILKDENPELSEEEIDHLAEVIYDELFPVK